MTAVEVNVMLSSSSSSRKLGPASVDSGGHSVSRTWDRERHKLGLTTAAAVGAALELMMGLFKLTINGQKGYQVQRVSEGTAIQAAAVEPDIQGQQQQRRSFSLADAEAAAVVVVVVADKGNKRTRQWCKTPPPPPLEHKKYAAFVATAAAADKSR